VTGGGVASYRYRDIIQYICLYFFENRSFVHCSNVSSSRVTPTVSPLSLLFRPAKAHRPTWSDQLEKDCGTPRLGNSRNHISHRRRAASIKQSTRAVVGYMCPTSSLVIYTRWETRFVVPGRSVKTCVFSCEARLESKVFKLIKIKNPFIFKQFCFSFLKSSVDKLLFSINAFLYSLWLLQYVCITEGCRLFL